jgi:catechol 2,3-dioxygenase-like lactoylglutathione lyase family enzyme
MQDNVPLTIGIDHVGFAVKDLAHARRFFRECLGWRVVGENESHPASFVSDGNGIVTLWQVEDPDIGLHHLALKVVGRSALEALHLHVAAWPGTVVEFAPERSGKGPKVHVMVREPGGTRIEFACVSPAAGKWRSRSSGAAAQCRRATGVCIARNHPPRYHPFYFDRCYDQLLSLA